VSEVTPEQAASAFAAWTTAERAQFFEHLEAGLRCCGQEQVTPARLLPVDDLTLPVGDLLVALKRCGVSDDLSLRTLLAMIPSLFAKRLR
jgi:hypothetical protein